MANSVSLKSPDSNRFEAKTYLQKSQKKVKNRSRSLNIHILTPQTHKHYMGSSPSFLSPGTCHCRLSAHRTGQDAPPVATWQMQAAAVLECGLGKRRSEKCRTSDWACHTTSAAGCLHSSEMWLAP